MSDFKVCTLNVNGARDATGNPGCIEDLKSKKAILADLLGSRAQGALVRSRFQSASMMDSPTKYFFSLEKKNGQGRLIHALRSAGGQQLTGNSQIRQRAVDFYCDLFTSEYTEDDGGFNLFCRGLPTVSEETNKELDGPLTEEELCEALRSMQRGKAPGIDGLPPEFYKTFWDFLKEDLMDLFNESFNDSFLPLSCRRAILTLLPKKGDLQEIKNWRPVSLLCTDYKLLSRALSSRLRKVMDQVVDRTQTYCVPGRSIVDNVSLIRDILEVSGSLGFDTGLVSLDQEKAFDRVEHRYLWKVLERFGLSPGFIAKIKVMYVNIESVLKINGGLSRPFNVTRGIRQGCSMSGGLTWKRGGLKYLGVHLGDEVTLGKNWEGVLEKVEGKLNKWRWLLPHMSYRGRVLVINNLCTLYLPKEEGGQGLVHLESRAAAFKLQFLQRYLTGNDDVVWRPVASTILRGVAGLGLDALLEEPLVWGARLDVQDGSRPALTERLQSVGVVKLRNIVDAAGPGLHNTEAVASLLGLKSARHTRTILNEWIKRLSDDEMEMLREYSNRKETPDEGDPFPDIGILADQDGLKHRLHADFHMLNGKVWRLFYKPPLNKRSGDLQWRILHGALGVNAFVSKINPTVSSECPFCTHRETITHCYLDFRDANFDKFEAGLLGGSAVFAVECPPAHQKPSEQCDMGPGHAALTALSRDGRDSQISEVAKMLYQQGLTELIHSSPSEQVAYLLVERASLLETSQGPSNLMGNGNIPSPLGTETQPLKHSQFLTKQWTDKLYSVFDVYDVDTQAEVRHLAGSLERECSRLERDLEEGSRRLAMAHNEIRHLTDELESAHLTQRVYEPELQAAQQEKATQTGSTETEEIW
ncbi:hypothetical protein JOQ06_014695 [Pogonophryne albipinna]|uniref:Reverse transcriptase domain-containing protein n=1 Tax=Pogonophryne albipinna TaxID=1090488 RepID=A0AAD6FB13_9TELE|nr:hypothetical protein JOQ06_014695 [Pogonophryne albipinna]